MIPLEVDAHPAGRHRAATVVQVVPVAALLQPPRRHRTARRAQVVPRGPHLHPASHHRPTVWIQVVPVHTREHPATGLSARRLVVVPLPALAHPPRAHVPRRIETVGRPVNDEGLARRVGAILVAIPPAAPIPLPRTRLRRGNGSLNADRGARGHERRLRRIGNAHRRLARAHRADDAVRADSGNGLVGGGPYDVGHARIRGLVGGAQRHALAHRQRRRLGRDGQLRHGNGREVHLHACPIDRPVPHLQVDARGVTTRTLDNLGERHLEVDVVQPVVPDLAPAVVLLAHERLAVLRPRESESREGRRVGGIKGQRAPIPLARNRHVRDDGRGRVQRDHVGQLLGDRRGATGCAFDGERVLAVRQLVPLLVVAIKPGRAVERVFRPGDLPVASV